MTSAYPIEVDTLVQRVQARAIELGKLPSRNKVMSEFKVGAPKATAALAALESAGFDPTAPDVTSIPVLTRRLHSVTADEPAEQMDPAPAPVPAVVEPSGQVTMTTDPEPHRAVEPVESVVPIPAEPERLEPERAKRVRSWPLLLLAAGAFVSIWGGWVGLGKLTGFGPIHLLPGIADSFVINSAITLPIGVEAYAAFALRIWLSGGTTGKARRFAMWSAIGSLVLGAAGQVAYHLMTAAGITAAPWPITTFVSCLPVVVLGCGAALAHLLHNDDEEAQR
jgi:hypothetical protein